MYFNGSFERRRFRAYRINADTDPLGDWLDGVTYGRIVRHYLQRHATAPKRIGVAYQLRDLTDPGQWLMKR